VSFLNSGTSCVYLLFAGGNIFITWNKKFNWGEIQRGKYPPLAHDFACKVVCVIPLAPADVEKVMRGGTAPFQRQGNRQEDGAHPPACFREGAKVYQLPSLVLRPAAAKST